MIKMHAVPALPLGQMMVERKIITQDQLSAALEEQNRSRGRFGSVLLRLGFVDEAAEFLPLVSEQLGVDYLSLRGREIPAEVIARVPVQFAAFYEIVPLECDGQFLCVAAVDPLDVEMIDALGMVFPGLIKAVLASEKEVLEAIRQYYGVGAETIDRMMGSALEQQAETSEVDDLTVLDDEASIGKFINQILLEAYKDRATDIHVEPFENRLQVRYRVDGILHDARVPANIWHFRDSISSRIKIMSNLNIAERRLPQDGRFKVKVGDVELDLRVSFLPAQFGESIVIRILSSAKLYSLPELGLGGHDLRMLDGLIRRTHGIVFVTGPTGSGKTTTLYSCLARLNNTERKIITIEDPVEYQLDGAIQVHVNPGIGLTFASGLRAMLRHDPDVMMVGEVRDLETAEIAIKIALTGHLVFSTLHTNDAASGVTRLIDMGVEPYLVSSSVECFIAQRLVRLLCPKCRQPGRLTTEQAADFHLGPEAAAGAGVYVNKGCPACNFTGYHGRQGIYEFLRLDEKIRNLVITRAQAGEIKAAAVKAGMRTMLQDGLAKVLAGVTSAAEVMRVVRDEG